MRSLFYEIRLTHDLYPYRGWLHAIRVGWQCWRIEKRTVKELANKKLVEELANKRFAEELKSSDRRRR